MLHRFEEVGNIVTLGKAPRIRVLIVERHPAVRRALCKRLSVTTQLDVVGSTGDLLSVMDRLSTTDERGDLPLAPDVIVLGIENGNDEQLFEMLRIVRRLTDHETAIVVLAPYADEVERALLQQAGVKRYLLKHIDSCRLIREIEAAAEQDRHLAPGS